MIGGNSTCPIDLLNEQFWAQIWAHNYGQGGTSLIHINTCSWLVLSSYYSLSLSSYELSKLWGNRPWPWSGFAKWISQWNIHFVSLKIQQEAAGAKGWEQKYLAIIFEPHGLSPASLLHTCITRPRVVVILLRIVHREHLRPPQLPNLRESVLREI